MRPSIALSTTLAHCFVECSNFAVSSKDIPFFLVDPNENLVFVECLSIFRLLDNRGYPDKYWAEDKHTNVTGHCKTTYVGRYTLQQTIFPEKHLASFENSVTYIEIVNILISISVTYVLHL